MSNQKEIDCLLLLKDLKRVYARVSWYHNSREANLRDEESREIYNNKGK